MEPTYERDGIRLYHASFEDVLPSLGIVDACIVDPPYGLKEARGKNKSRGNLAVAIDYGDEDWDDETLSPEQVQMIRSHSRWQIWWGGNYYDLPPSKCWLVWDKISGTNDFADCELAWTNLPKAVRLIRYLWNGMLRDGYDQKGFHPTQKPVDVMRWCISHLPKDVETVMDCCMGSGTTCLAAIREGKKFIGVEKHGPYFENAVKRVKAELRRHPLFDAVPVQQTCLFGEPV